MSRFALRRHVHLVFVDVEDGLRRVFDAPDDDGGDLDRIAAAVVDLQLLAIERSSAQ